MGVYGSTYKGAFSGLGKPSIKLEFEDNDQLLAFQRRIDGGADGEEQGGAAYDPELANYDQKRLDEAVANHNTIGWGMSDELRDGWTKLHSDAAPKGYDVMIKGTRPALRLGTYGWEFQSSTDAQLVPKEKGLKAHKGGELEGLTQTQLYNYIFANIEPLTPINTRGLVHSDREEIFNNEFGKFDKNGNYTVNTPIGNVYVSHAGLFGHLTKHAAVKEAVNVIKKTLQNPAVVFDGEDKDGNKSIVFVKAFLINRKPVFAVVSSIDRQANYLKSNIPPHSTNYIYNLYKKGGENILHPSKISCDGKGLTLNAIPPELPPFDIVEFRLPITITENGAKSCIINENSLGAPGDVYLVTDTRTKPRKELDETTALKKYNIRPLTGEDD